MVLGEVAHRNANAKQAMIRRVEWSPPKLAPGKPMKLPWPPAIPAKSSGIPQGNSILEARIFYSLARGFDFKGSIRVRNRKW